MSQQASPGGAPLRAAEVRTLFAQALDETAPDGRLNYRDFYTWLRRRGLRPKGGTVKEQQRSIYTALLSGTAFVKVDPGVFSRSTKP